MNHSDLEIFIKTLVTLFVLMDPVGIVPIFIALTRGHTLAQKKESAKHIAVVVVLVLIISTLFGNEILSYFFIGVTEFKVSGGLLLLLMSIQMLMSDNSGSVSSDDRVDKYSRGRLITPLGIPLLAGPGAIGTVIIYGQNAHGIMSYGLILIDVVIASFVAYLAMYHASSIARLLGNIGIEIVTKIAGLILGAIAIRFICQGLIGLLPGLG